MRARTLAVVLAAAAVAVALAAAVGPLTAVERVPRRVDSPPGPYHRVTDLLANPSFEDGRRPGGRPVEWGGGNATHAKMVDTSTSHDGRASARVHRTRDSDGEFGTITSCSTAASAAGGTIRYTGFLKSADAGWGGLWMRVDGPKGSKRPLAFDNMRDRAVRGTTGWERFAVELPVPADATGICLGVLLAGEGTLWADELTLELARAGGGAMSSP